MREKDSNIDRDEETASMKYSEAMSELQTILERLEDDGVDLDELSVLVERAAQLIKFCQSRITESEMQVRQIIEDLDDELAT